jgi:hypothetical protein
LIVYFDTSVLVAYYTQEERSSDAKAFVERAELPVLSDLCIAELFVVLGRKAQLGFLAAEAVAEVLDLFDLHVQESFVRMRLDDDQLRIVRDLPHRTGLPLRTLDSLHLAAAIDAGAAIATFDGRLAAAGTALGLEVLA